MGFTFLHSADWQIGKPFRTFPANVAGRLEEARLTALDRLAASARDVGARHILVAGDVFDGSNLPSKERRQPMERMKRHDDLTWVLLPGNHDPARPGGIWEESAKDGLPKNVITLLEPKPHQLTPEVVILPAPLTAKSATNDPTAWMDDATTSEGQTRIGLAHGSVRGFGSDDDSSINIDPARAAKAGLAYLALGDWHGLARINAKTWYAGTPEPDRFRDNEPGHALAVKLNEKNGEPDVTPRPVAHFTWGRMVASLRDGEPVSDLDATVAKLAADPARLLLRLSFEGIADADQLMQIERWQHEWDAKLQHLEIDTTKLRTNIDPDDVSVIAESSELSQAATQLSETAATDDQKQAGLASKALRHLLVFAHAAREKG